MLIEFGETILCLHVRPNDLDSLGHVNNAVAMEYLETGRWDWLARNGLRRRNPILPVVSRAEVNYWKELFPPAVRVRTRLDQHECSRLDEEFVTYQAVFRQRIFSGAGPDTSPAIEARINVAFIDSELRTIRTLQDFLMTNAVIEVKAGGPR